MRICLICVEIFAWGKYGGFGRATRMIGRELVRRGRDVADRGLDDVHLDRDVFEVAVAEAVGRDAYGAGHGDGDGE